VITTELSLYDKFLAKFLMNEHSENEIKIMYKFLYQLKQKNEYKQQYSETNMMHFLFNLLRIKRLYMF
jgi:hypothetical protein